MGPQKFQENPGWWNSICPDSSLRCKRGNRVDIQVLIDVEDPSEEADILAWGSKQPTKGVIQKQWYPSANQTIAHGKSQSFLVKTDQNGGFFFPASYVSWPECYQYLELIV